MPSEAPIAAPEQPGGSQASAGAAQPWWRRALPFVVALGLVAFALRRVDLRSFWARVTEANAPLFMLFMTVFVLLLLTADSFATVRIYRRGVAPVRFRDFWVLRGASYLPSLLNHHVGQAFITLFVSRAYKVPLSRVAGATLLVYATWTGCVLGIGCAALIVAGKQLVWLGLILAAGIGYLALLAVKPARLARITVLAPLFEAGVRGHLEALVTRFPHAVVIFLGTWLPFKFFGVHIPIGAALSYVPILMVAITLPITPQGFGTRDLLAAAFFEMYAPGATHADRLATLAAATTSTGVAITLVDAVIGLCLLRRATAQLGGDRP